MLHLEAAYFVRSLDREVVVTPIAADEIEERSEDPRS